MKFAKNIATHTQVPHGGLYSIKNPTPKIIDFSSNINPLGYPKSVRKLNWTSKIPVYPDHTSLKLKTQLAKYLRVHPKNLVVGNGATEIIYDFCRATITKSTPVLIAVPTFGEYEAASSLCNAKLRFFKTMNLEEDLLNFIKKIPKKGIVFICNPNNPTGTLMRKNSLLKIVKHAKTKDTFVFVDECFMELSQLPDQSIVKQTSRFENLFVLRSLTKSFGLAGLRIGYGVGSKKFVTILNRIKIPWSVSWPAQEAAISALADSSFLAKTKKLIRTESDFLRKSLSKLNGLSCLETSTNFILIKTKMDSQHLQKKLLKKNILVRDCSTFRGLGKNYIRIAVRTHKENLKLLKALEEII
ncbi:MAG TPA: threonine-phosphate decarboxylase CobD [Candidatus Nitrosotenuis sp.]|nr:threonine-phosphate decarboxylase CobD [Candidatus Nitrosotenuis sp.]